MVVPAFFRFVVVHQVSAAIVGHIRQLSGNIIIFITGRENIILLIRAHHTTDGLSRQELRAVGVTQLPDFFIRIKVQQVKVTITVHVLTGEFFFTGVEQARAGGVVSLKAATGQWSPATELRGVSTVVSGDKGIKVMIDT